MQHLLGEAWICRCLSSTAPGLELYAERFETVEINATFYPCGRQRRSSAGRSRTPEDFCFAVKASRYLTHVRRLQGLDDGILRLEERIKPLRSTSKLGPMLWPPPGSSYRGDDRLAAALRLLLDGRHAFEFRHELVRR